MENPHSVLSVALEVIVTVSVATVVWTTLVAGLCQLIHARIRRARGVTERHAQERYAQRTEPGQQVAHPQPTAGH